MWPLAHLNLRLSTSELMSSNVDRRGIPSLYDMAEQRSKEGEKEKEEHQIL